MDSKTLDLSATSLAIVKRIDDEFEGREFDAVFRLMKEMAGDSTEMNLQVNTVELGVLGLLAANCAESELPADGIRRKQLVNRCVILLQATPLNAGVVMGNPDLAWFRQTPDFLELKSQLESSWHQLQQ